MIEVPEWLNEQTIERAYGRAMQALERHDEGFAEVGLRAARARDPRLMKVLEHGANILAKVVDRQWGRYQRNTEHFGHKAELTELGLWRQAYEWADKGEPLYEFKWIYGCAAEVAGLRP